MTSGAARILWRPHSWVFWAYVGTFVIGAALWSTVFTEGVKAQFWVAAIGWVVALGALLAVLIRRLDLFRGNQGALLAAAFLWGAVPATAFAVRANHVLLAGFDRYLSGFRAWDAAAVAPLVEESLKAVGIVAVVLIGRPYVVRASQGAVIGAVTGLGFQLIENINYVLNAAAGRLEIAVGTGPLSSAAAVASTIVTRTVTAPSSHWLFSALVGLGVGYAVVHRARPTARRAVVVATLCIAAAGMHFAIDSPEPAGAFLIVLTVGKMVTILLLGYVIYVYAMRAEWRRFAAVAGTEPADVIAPADVAALRSHRTRRRARNHTRAEAGRVSARSLTQLQLAQLRLVNELMRTGDDPQLRVEVQQIRARAYRIAGAPAGRNP